MKLLADSVPTEPVAACTFWLVTALEMSLVVMPSARIRFGFIQIRML